jgi:ribosomal protein S18 acetylase RimI-like enzyme
MNSILVNKIYLEDDISSAMSSCSDSLFNQSINNPDVLKKLSKKYAENGLCYVVYLGKEISGFVSCYVNDYNTKKGFLSIIVVKQKFQGLGIGSLLLDVVLTSCKLEGMEELLLEVDKDNESAIMFYNQRGFSVKQKQSPTSIILSKRIH